METDEASPSSSIHFELEIKDVKTLIKRKPVKCLTKEEKAERRRNNRIAHERDRERKRAKRQNPAYRMMEQTRDRERKKVLRSDQSFRMLEKIRDRMRKEQKRFCAAHNLKPGDVKAILGDPLMEPEVILSTSTTSNEDTVIISDPLLEPEVVLTTVDSGQQQQPNLYNQTDLPQQYNMQIKVDPLSQDDF